ncbi:glycosyltransferase 87 family protein [Micromonospora aurantiaca]|uniref:glycosyltransferase 87 family protein n=1 Tax=Micromonospora aurantiaca (nom. illeg.) TaxID=47850 RepID=UPI003811C121
MAVSRLRALATMVPADRPAPPPVTLPSWLLLPGLLALAGSLAAYAVFLDHDPLRGTDLSMYIGGARSFLHGEPVYRLGYTTLNLPYTYPPITLPFLTPLTLLDDRAALYVWTVAGLLAMLATLWFTTRMLGYRGAPGRLGLAAAVLAVLVWTEPLHRTFYLGQINVFVLLLVVADLARPDRSRFKGVGIGVATSVKLLPGLFVVYLLLTRRIRAALVAGATFAGLTVLGAIIQPGGSYDYWIAGRAFDSSRPLATSGPRYAANQSLQGLVARLLGSDELNSRPWMLAAALAGMAGLALAVALHRQGEEAAAMVVVGFTTLAVSPVSWSHYWLWIGPAALVLIDLARRARGPARVPAAVLAVAAVLPFLLWPGRDRTGATVPRGLIWKAAHLEGTAKTLAVDAYLLTVLALGLIAAVWLSLRRRRCPVAAAEPVPAEREPV